MNEQTQIDQILKEQQLPIRHTAVRLAMEQYGKARYDIGSAVGYTAGFKACENRLQALVQAQKEYIEFMHIELGTPCWEAAEDLRNKIKELEK